ncbi:MAG: ribulose-phosphate 3-epimerase [Ignavibacteriales bacterium]
MTGIEIVPSLASANQACLGGEIKRLGDSAKIIHLDVEDGNFTPNITFGLKTIRDLRQVTELPFSIHLMVTNPEDYLPEISEIPSASVAVHVEACRYPGRIVNMAKHLGTPIGMALNPKTQVQEIEYLLGQLDFVLVMTSEEDYESQRFLPGMLGKVRVLSAAGLKGRRLWVDGGIKREHLYDIWESGAGAVVMGRAVFGADNPAEEIRQIENIVNAFSQGGRQR